MVEAAPSAPFIITKAEFLFELLIITLDAPPQLCQINQAVEGDILGQGGEPILGRFGFVLRQTSSFCRAHLAVRSRKPPCRHASGTLTCSLKLRVIVAFSNPYRDQVAL